MIEKTKYWQRIEKLISLKTSTIIDDSITVYLEEIPELNRQQLSRAEYVSGNKLPEYSDISKEFYGKQDGGMTLYDSGDYYDSLKAVFSNDKSQIDLLSQPIKGDLAKNIEKEYGENYGEEVKGLNDENLTIIKEGVAEEARERIRALLFNS